MKRKRILKQMFDIKPVKEDGSLDLEKIGSAERILRVEQKKTFSKIIFYPKVSDIKSTSELLYADFSSAASKVPKITRISRKYQLPAREPMTAESQKAPAKISRPNVIHLGKIVSGNLIYISKVPSHRVFTNTAVSEETSEEKAFSLVTSREKTLKPTKEVAKLFKSKSKFQFSNIFSLDTFNREKFSYSYAFLAVTLVFSMIIPTLAFVHKGIETKNLLIDSQNNILGELAEAKDNFASGQFSKASSNFEASHEILKEANVEVSKIGGNFSEIIRFLPGISKIATANYLLNAGEKIALSGKSIADLMESLANIENPLNGEGGAPLGEFFLNLRDGVREAAQNLEIANEDIQKANFDDLPVEIQPRFLELKEKLPLIVSNLQSFTNNSNIILDMLGYNGPRKFLFLFQNNQEMRATGGFIGSYGLLDISNGKVKKILVDDIYNPDGQLMARVIPPEPIQKMSAVWTMHDANWFPNFPTSAEKVAWFYEKTGGPTVDGIIAMTPDVIEKMLSLTGPIEMPEYDTTVNEENFREVVQYEVEVDYDKEENRPKKFIADLTPRVLDRLFDTRDSKAVLKMINVLGTALREKHILVYFKNYNLQKIASEQHWSGEVLDAEKDYLSIINTNINGYKTDAVIEETIEHHACLKEDGSITDEVIITRKHNGGNEKYDWWNKVNGDWLRVYVPEGSKLLEVSGQTREFVSPPLDYQSLHFKKDPQLLQEEQNMKIDDESGTRIYTENHKTVFANWVYVSPGETAVVKYKYQLPFRLSFDTLHHPADVFSILYQKQSGSLGSRLTSEITLPQNMRTIWHWPENIAVKGNSLTINTSLDTDKFVGIAVENVK